MLGDIFRHVNTESHPPTFQLWLRVLGDDGDEIWEEIKIGYQRADGKVLNLTEQKHEPSWVTARYFDRISRNRQKLLAG